MELKDVNVDSFCLFAPHPINCGLVDGQRLLRDARAVEFVLVLGIGEARIALREEGLLTDQRAEGRALSDTDSSVGPRRWPA